MSEKRFIDGGEECIEDQFLIDTLTDKYYWIDNGLDDIVNMLNALHEENEQLKHTVHKHSLQIIAQSNKIIELEKENKRFIKMLDNVANYMQKEHKEIPVNQFVDWWNNIATMGIKE